MPYARMANLPMRIAAGSFILNSGLSKLAADKEHAKRVHATAKTSYPFVEHVDALQFTKVFGIAETVLGAALLLPTVTDGLTGAALTAFSGGLLKLYATTPGMAPGRQPASEPAGHPVRQGRMAFRHRVEPGGGLHPEPAAPQETGPGRARLTQR
jgi:hypothetical protein